MFHCKMHCYSSGETNEISYEKGSTMDKKSIYLELGKRLLKINSDPKFVIPEMLTIYGLEEARAVLDFLKENPNCSKTDYSIMRVNKKNEIRSYRSQSGIMGLVVGDALGVPVEFTSRAERDMDPVVGMRAYGTHSQPAGTWSDDTSMVLATMEWYDELKEWPENYTDLMDKFCNWLMYGEYTPYGENFDNGLTVSRALINYSRGTAPLESGDKSEFSNGNGALMRILPTALFHTVDLASDHIHYAEKIYEMCSLTHGHARSKLGCLLYSKIIADIFHKPDDDKKDIIQYSLGVIEKYLQSEEKNQGIIAEHDAFHRLWDVNKFIALSRDDIRSSGYVVDTLEAALWCFLTTDSYKECVLKAVNLGDDTDTVGAVAGGLAGYYYGIESIPIDWIEIIPKKDIILDLASRMYN